jgi:hypothetical protein
VTVISSDTAAGVNSAFNWSVRAAASAMLLLTVCIPCNSNVIV